MRDYAERIEIRSNLSKALGWEFIEELWPDAFGELHAGWQRGKERWLHDFPPVDLDGEGMLTMFGEAASRRLEVEVTMSCDGVSFATVWPHEAIGPRGNRVGVPGEPVAEVLALALTEALNV